MGNFEKKVLQLVKKIPQGKVSTYKLIAKALGRPKASRAVGKALNKNPKLIVVPCHRVIKSDGSLGGYKLGQKAKERLLEKERLIIKGNKIVNFKKFLHL